MSSQPSSSSPTPQRFNVYKVRDGPVDPPDPDVPGVRYHHVIFVETAADGTGVVHNVTGDLVVGMHYERRPSPRPEASESFYSKEFLGTVLASSYPSAIDRVCEALPPPPPQKKFNVTTMTTEPFKPDGTFYKPGEPRRPLIKCTEWTEQQAIPALLLSGAVERTTPVTLGPSASASSHLSSPRSASRRSASQASSGQGYRSEKGSADRI